MNREVKFRVWVPYNNTMYCNKDILAIYPRAGTIEILGIKEMLSLKSEAVLMQDIGINDKKRTEEYPEGQLIYKGDIVRCWGGEYCQGHWEYDNAIVVSDIYDCFMIKESENIEVIGNIYNKPVLKFEGGCENKNETV